VGNGQGQPNALYRNDGTGTFTPEPAFGDSNHTIAIAWGDVDADGDLDLAVGNGLLGHHEQNELYRNRGDGTFVREPAFGEGQTAALVLTDVEGDGDLDAVVGNGGFGAVAANALYLNRGDGIFDGRPEFGEGDTACMVAGDLDGDGDVDVCVANWGDVDRQNRLYRNDGTGRFIGEDAFGDRDTNTLALCDVDHDGDLDLATGNGDFRSADQNHLYLNDGTGHFEERAALGEGSTDAIVWADLDGDGDLDALVGNEHSPTQNLIFDNATDDDAWLLVTLRGGRRPDRAAGSNRSAIGARVLVYAAGHLGEADHLLGVREVVGHGGFASQPHLAVHFGLPGRDTVDVEVRWPPTSRGSHVQDRRGVPVGAHLVIRQGTKWVRIVVLVAALSAVAKLLLGK